MKLANRNDGSYFCYTGVRDYIGIVRRLSKTRWMAVTPSAPVPDAAEFKTRREAAAWLRQQARTA